MMTRHAEALAVVLLFAALLFALAGCKSSSHEKEVVLTPAQVRGKEVYQEYCALCHREGKQGPELAGLFQKQYLPSGTPANDDRVRDVITIGRATMPGFGRMLSPAQINDLIAYLHAF
ncbi:MAG TPA: cytochrome c [Terriglobales bacterium]|nr:cytochrome c [Terriglobales bacterium]